MKHSKVNLEKKYLYLPMMSRPNQNCSNIYNLIQQLVIFESKGTLEEVASLDFYCSSRKKELHELKVKTMKELILNNKQIPEKWIFKSDYQQILDEAMSDPFVLQHAIIHADLFKRRAYPDLNKPKNLLSRSVTFSRNALRISPKKKQNLNKANIITNEMNEDNNKEEQEEFLLTALGNKTYEPVKLPPIKQ